MSAHHLETTLAVSSQAPQIALVNPAASGVVIEAVSVVAFGEQGQSIRVARYDVEVGVSLTSSMPQVHAHDAGSSAATAATKDSHAITPPSGNDLTFSARIFDDPTDTSLPIGRPIRVPPGSSLLVETINEFGGDGPLMTFQIEWQEEPVQPVAYATGQALPESGAWSSFDWFDLPMHWESIAARVAYTAHAQATKGRPKVRAVWSDGINEWVQPIVSSSLDTSAAPVGLRSTYCLVEPFPAIVAGGATEAHAFAYTVFPGATRVRFDVAEVDPAEANEGTVTVTITGS